jgi:hypothetical protein
MAESWPKERKRKKEEKQTRANVNPEDKNIILCIKEKKNRRGT